VSQASARNLAAVRELEERLRAAQAEVADLKSRLAANLRELEAVNRELEAFSYSVSHDLRAPLRHVSGFADLLERHAGASLDEKGTRYVTTIREAVARMAKLIDDLLSFSRLSRQEMRLSRVRLDEEMASVIGTAADEIRERTVAVDVAPLPDVMGDAALLRVVFTNLIGNALKYTRPRSDARIEIGALPGESAREAVLFVRDNGVGFDTKYADRLFGVFQRLHGAEFEGTGIGLATAQRIVHRHGGRIWAQSEVGRGATFYLALPAAPPAEG
jgi:light-regulated signal transduction histidine kinase (bacteriophytochrome)